MTRPGRFILVVIGSAVVLTSLAAVPLLLWADDVKDEPRGEAGRADEAAFARLRRDPVVRLRPPGVGSVEVNEYPPCGGDSGSGLSVVVSGSAPKRDEAVFGFYRERLASLGWNSIRREHVPSAGGDYDQVSATKRQGGYRLNVAIRNIGSGKQAFDVVVSAEPRYQCSVY
jgi:hypothetical protein